MAGEPPPDVAAAAARVEEWLKQPPARVSEAEYAKMSPAERLDYARQFDQSQFQTSDR
jgi:hypothetical protein